MSTDTEPVRQHSWSGDGPAQLELGIDVGRVRVELVAADEPAAADQVRIELRHDPAAGNAWTQGISGLISWLGGTAGAPVRAEAHDPVTLAADAVAAAEVSWDEATRRLVVRNCQELPLRVVPLAVTVTAPAGSRLSVRTGAGDVTVIGSAGECDVTTGSGEVSLGAVRGRTRVRTGSGRIALAAAAGPTDIKAGSGDVRVGEIAGDLRVRAGSGDVDLADARSGSVELVTGSGRLTVGVHPGVGAELDLSSGSGRTRSELDVGKVAPAQAPALRVRGRTGSGDVLVTRAVVPV